MKYYSTSSVITLKQFIETEVTDRDNYTLDEVNEWMKKYNLTFESFVIWAASEKWIAWRYAESVDNWDDIDYLKKQAEINDSEISEYTGEIITESDDGDDGYILIVRR